MMIRIRLIICAALFISVGNHVCAKQFQEISDDFGVAAGHYERQEYDEAITKFRDVIQKYPSTRQAAISHFFLGESLVQKMDYRGAFPAYKIFLQRMPQDEYAVRANFRMAECAYRLNWETQAVELLEEFVTENAQHSLNEYALTYLGEMRLQRKEPQIAVNVFDQALVQFPRSTNTLKNRFGLAKALQALGRTQEAIRFYELILRDPVSPLAGKAQAQLAVIDFKNGDYEQARQKLAQALEWTDAEAENTEILYWIAKSEMALGHHEKAFGNYAKVIESAAKPELKAAVLFDGAVAASKTDKPDTAIAWIDRLRKVWPDSKWADDALQLEIELLYQLGRHDRALSLIEQFEKDYSIDDRWPLILEYKGRMLYDRKQYSDSVELFSRLLQEHAKRGLFDARLNQWRYLKGLAQLGESKFASASETFALLDTTDQDVEFRSLVLLAEATCAKGMNQPLRESELLTEFLAIESAAESVDRARADLMIALARSKQWDKIDELLENLGTEIADHSNILNSQLLVAELALKHKRYDLSERCFRDLARPSNPRKFVVQGLSGMAWVQLTRGDQQSAVAVFGRLVDEYSETKFAAEAAMVCGKHFEQVKNFEKAIEMYELVDQKFKTSEFAGLAKLRVAICLCQAKDRSADSLRIAEQILNSQLELETEYSEDVQYQLAWIYADTNRPDGAHELFEKIVANPKSVFWPDAAYRVAKRYVEDEQYDEAETLIEKLIEISPPAEIQTRAYFLKGQIAAKAGRWMDVQSCMKHVLDQSDDQVLRKRSRYWLAESMFQSKDYVPAAREFQRLIDRPELINADRLAWSELRFVQCHAGQEKWTAALELSELALKKYPDFQASYEFDFIIGRAHAAQGRLVEARQSYKKVIESKTGNTTQTAAMAQWRIGETYFHQEKYERAIEAFYRVDSLYGYDKWRAAALVEAGKCQEHLGNWNHAVRLYQQLLDKFPQSPFRLAAENRLNLATRHANRLETETQKK